MVRRLQGRHDRAPPPPSGLHRLRQPRFSVNGLSARGACRSLARGA